MKDSFGLRISVIVVAYNAERTIEQSLAAIFQAIEGYDAEVIVVNDGSVDRSRDLIKEYACKLIDLTDNQGRANARNVGARHATGDILVFIDSDVVIPSDALTKIVERFQSNEDVIVVNGILAAEVEGLNFWSDYKNLYMNYNFKQMPEWVDFIFSSFVAIKKEYFLPFKNYKATDDTELGMRMARTHNKKIFLAKDIEVSHLKLYTFFGLLRNDFRVASDWASLFLKNKSYKDLFKKRRFAHANSNQLLSLFFVGVAALGFALILFAGQAAILTFTTSILLAVLIRADFFRFTYKKKGFIFLIGSMGLFLVDSVAHIAGILVGLLFPQTPREI